MRTTIVASALCVAGFAVLAWPTAGYGQSIPTGRLNVAGELGTRSFTHQPSLNDRAKFEEYRSTPSGVVLQHLLLGYMPADSFRLFQLEVRKAGQADQAALLRLMLPGRLDIRGSWDRVPHVFSTNGRMLGTQVGQDLFRLPSPRPDTSTWNTSAPLIGAVRTKWDVAKLSTTYTPSENWELKAEYTTVGKGGQRPMGMAFGGPGNNTREVLEPIDQRTSDLRFAPAYTNGRVQLTGMVDFSFFENSFSSVSADNPLLGADATAGAAMGRTALAPNNTAQTAVLNAAVSLPFTTRVYGNASYASWHQNATFIAPTSNSLLVGDPRLANLPTHLGGNTGTMQLGISGVSRPFKPVTLSAKYREFRYRDHTELDVMPALVLNDRSIIAAAERERLPFTRKNGDVTASWHVGYVPITVTASQLWDHVEREPEVRNVAQLTDISTRASIDYIPADWLSVRAAMTRGFRRSPMPYRQDAGDMPEHRRFDEADRNRDRGIFKLLLTPHDAISFAANWEIGRDEYPHSLYGVQSDHSTMVGGDAVWTPSARWSFDASHTRETFLNRFRSRYRTGNQLANVTYDWVANNRDEINTTSAGMRAVLVPGRWEAGGQFSLSDASFVLATYNPLTPTGGTAVQNLAATAADLPRVTQKLQPLMLFVRYAYSEDWAATLRFQAERYDQNDFRTLDLRLEEGGGIFLGNNFNSYNANYLTFTMSYRPSLLRLGRPAM